MQYPDAFEKKIIGAFGEIGSKWLGSLEDTVAEYLKKWKLESLGPVDNLSYNYVLKVMNEKQNNAILKLGIPNYDFANEVRTLQTYNGEGCVRILRAEPEHGAMLLEHVLPGNMLLGLTEEATVHHFASVWKAIRRTVDANANHPSIGDWMTSLDRYLKNIPEDAPIAKDYIFQAKAYHEEIKQTSSGAELLHGDLHHENILYSEKVGWIAIDPKGVIGDSYFDVVSFLTNHLFEKSNPRELLEVRVNLLCSELQLDKSRLLKAAVALSILYAVWGIEDHTDDWENSFTCAKWFQEMNK